MNELVIHLRQRCRYPWILLREMVVTDFKLKYQASLLGYLWTLLKPLAMFTILYVVFAVLLRFGEDIPFYAISLLFGLVIWAFFAEVTSNGLTSLVLRADLLRKVSFPRYVVVLSIGVSALITFGLNLIVIAVFMVVAQVPIGWRVFWLIPVFLELMALSAGGALYLSALYVRFRDMTYIWDVLLQAGFYATPIFYPLTMLPPDWARLALLNPMAQIIQDARYALISDQTLTIGQLYSTPWVRLVPIVLTLAILVSGLSFFRRRSPSFAEEA